MVLVLNTAEAVRAREPEGRRRRELRTHMKKCIHHGSQSLRQKINRWTEAICERVELSEQPDSWRGEGAVESAAAIATATAEAIRRLALGRDGWSGCWGVVV